MFRGSHIYLHPTDLIMEWIAWAESLSAGPLLKTRFSLLTGVLWDHATQHTCVNLDRGTHQLLLMGVVGWGLKIDFYVSLPN